MTIAPGTRIGPYEVTSRIGEGGMGVVYRAHDTQLKRDVALKVLPDHFADDPDRLVRFQREAQVLASLNHQNIAQIHGLERTAGSSCIVMELVEGETLAERLQRGPIPIDDAIRFANQIADALEAAHARGIIHRDLKPANIKVTPQGTVKVLDFGLAKAFDAEKPVADLSTSPTRMSGSVAGVIMGTAAYMSPEQARGKDVDTRTDLWAFGCVLYEMLTGHAVFKGETATDIIAKIIEGRPDWSLLPRETPPGVRMFLEATLTKDAKLRLQHAGDARLFLTLNRAVLHYVENPAVPSRGRRSWVLIAALSVALVAALVPASVYFFRTPEEPGEVRFEMPAPGIVQNSLTISPDGQYIAYVSNEGQRSIWIRPLGAIKAERLLGTEAAAGLASFWSPDSRFIAFVADRKLKKISITGRIPVEIGDADVTGPGAWNSDGVILYSKALGPSYPRIVRITDSGGEAKPVTEVDPSRPPGLQVLPQFLPDNRHFLFHDVPASGAITSAGRASAARVYVGSLDSKSATVIAGLDINLLESPAVYAAPGYILFVRDRTLVAQKFDAGRSAVTGDPIPIAEQVSDFSVSDNRRLVYQKSLPGSAASRAANQLVWFDRKGMRIGEIGAPSDYNSVSLSRDGRHLAVDALESGNRDIWRIDIDRGTRDRLTNDLAPDLLPIWEPDGARLVFASQRGDSAIPNPKLFVRSSNSVGADTLLFKGNLTEGSLPQDWSPDGESIIFLLRDGAQARRWDLWVKLASSDEKPSAYIQSEFRKSQAQFSPNGRWVAYTTNESGMDQVVVQSFPDPTKGKWPVSTNGGVQPRWRRDGRELFYLAPDGKLMAVDVKETPDFFPGPPHPLFSMPIQPFGTAGPPLGGFSYDVTPDGQRFIVISPVSNSGASSTATDTPPITVVLNWTAALRKAK